ncbi:MAG: hypothetical protein KDE46_01500, partial [Caldilineaceae bacterium]|nr:hypothetical protein [Caldilineaceae bacterium]
MGGGISLFYGSANIVNSTISNNSAAKNGGGIHVGGVSDQTVSVELSNTSIVENSAITGGGIYASRALIVDNGNSQTIFYSTGAEITAHNSLIAINAASDSPDCYDELEDEPRYLIISNGFNLIGKDTGCNLQRDPTDLIGTDAEPIDPMISSLRNNGGPTYTHELLAGSPAAENGPATCTTPDQRGYERPIGRNCDIGSVENENPPPASVDFIADKLEVTQVVQDLNNSVRLVAGKRTVVRFHVKATNDESWAYAELLVESGGKSIRLKPTSRIRTRISPDRGI